MPQLKGPVPQVQAKEGPMPQLVKKRRSGWAVLAAGALVASLFAVGAAPAAALDEDSKPNAEAATSACVGDATGDMMFSDVSEMNALRAEINCLAYYGVTVGYGDGNFGPNDDVTRGQMVLFMERAAAVAGADAEAVVGDFAETGSDPVTRADMALLIARLLDSATETVDTAGDGTFTVDGVTGDDWDYFADSRNTQNRVKDSAASALYELGVAKGTGMGYFSPAASVSRAEMAAFITRALAHTSARPAGLTMQSSGPGVVLVSVRDANFHPVANAPIDIFSIASSKVDEAFNEDGSCNTPRLTGEQGNTELCEINVLDDGSGLDGDLMVTVQTVHEGGTTVWAWTGETGDEVEDGGEGLAMVELTETAPVSALNAKVTTDMARGANRAAFGSTITATIQLVGAEGADAIPPEGGASYRVFVRTEADALNAASDDLDTEVTAVSDSSTTATVTRHTLNVDASGKVTFTMTAVDPDPNNDDDPETGSVERVRVTYTVTQLSGPFATPGDSTSGQATVTDGTGTITFSDAPSVHRNAAITPTADYLAAPRSGGSASNVVTVTVTDQYGKGVRGHLVRLSSAHAPAGTPANTSRFPVARRTDSNGSVRIGYSYTGGASVETLTPNTATDTTDGATLTAFTNTGVTKAVYWAATLMAADLASGVVLVIDAERNTLIVGSSDGPQLVRYDDNDQFTVSDSSATPALTDAPITMARFEQYLAADGANNTARNDAVVVSSYDVTDAGDVSRFALTIN